MSEFDAERALKEGAVIEAGIDVEILTINANSSFPIVGLVRKRSGDVVKQWAKDGIFGGCQGLNLKKPGLCRVLKRGFKMTIEMAIIISSIWISCGLASFGVKEDGSLLVAAITTIALLFIV